MKSNKLILTQKHSTEVEKKVQVHQNTVSTGSKVEPTFPATQGFKVRYHDTGP